MDAPGLIVTYPEENGLVRVAPLGNVGADKQTDFAAVRFCTVSDGTRTGVLLPNKADENPREAHVDFGFADGCEAKQIVAPGDPLYLCPPPVPLAGDLLYAPALGNKLCAAALCLAFEKNGRLPESDLQVVFCAQTALGNRGASSAAYAVTPDFALCLEPYEGTVPGVKVFDRSLVCDEALTDALREAARQCGTELMSVVAPEENSDAARVHAAGAGVPTAVLLLPVGHRGALLERAHTDTVFTLAAIIEKFLNNR